MIICWWFQTFLFSPLLGEDSHFDYFSNIRSTSPASVGSGEAQFPYEPSTRYDHCFCRLAEQEIGELGSVADEVVGTDRVLPWVKNRT